MELYGFPIKAEQHEFQGSCRKEYIYLNLFNKKRHFNQILMYSRFPSSRTRIVSASRIVGKTIESLPIDRRSAIVKALSEITRCLSKTKRA